MRLNRRAVGQFGSAVGAVVLTWFVAYGFLLLVTVVTGLVQGLVWLVLVVVLVLRWRAPGMALWLGAFFVPVVAFVGANGLWERFGPSRPGAVLGLVIAAAVIAVASEIYFHSWWTGRKPRLPGLWALGIALGLVVLPPGAAMVLNGGSDDTLPADDPVSQLHVLVVRDADDQSKLEQAPSIDGWHLSYSVGRAVGTRTLWEDGAPPQRRPNADRAVVLVPEPGARVRRWMNIERRLRGRLTKRKAPTLVLLAATDRTRAEEWERAGKVLARPGPDEAPNVGEIALVGVARSNTAEQDLALAARHRPAIFFDSEEVFARPLNIDSLLQTGKLRLCPEDRPGIASFCDEIDGSDDLRNGDNHLEFDGADVATATSDTTIYVHPVQGVENGRDVLYLDYWWYFPENPTYSADGALCGEGFVIVGFLCFDHQSDWEGVTVVLDVKTERPIAVHYAAHADITRYRWNQLETLWATRPLPPAATSVDTGVRPLVFVARGTHASYPVACARQECTQIGHDLEEKRYDGGHPWIENDERACALTCVTSLPTHNEGTEPARWNAYDGRWGSSECDFLGLCERSGAPRAPAQQGRYKKPSCPKRVAQLDKRGRVSTEPHPCAEARPNTSREREELSMDTTAVVLVLLVAITTITVVGLLKGELDGDKVMLIITLALGISGGGAAGALVADDSSTDAANEAADKVTPAVESVEQEVQALKEGLRTIEQGGRQNRPGGE